MTRTTRIRTYVSRPGMGRVSEFGALLADTLIAELVFRKSDVRKKGKTRGWELMLSHNFRTGITSGFAKGTESSELVESIRHLTACRGQVGHPLLLPIIILSHELSSKNDQKQREARDWLRRLEHAVSMRSEIEEREGYVRDNVIDLDAINRDLVECHSQVLWKRPQAYQEIIREIEKAMHRFWDRLPEERRNSDEGRDLDKLHRSMFSRLEFYMVKLKGIENYAHTTLERLTIQRSAVRVRTGRSSRGERMLLTQDTAVQHHRSEGIKAQSRDGWTAAPVGSRQQA